MSLLLSRRRFYATKNQKDEHTRSKNNYNVLYTELCPAAEGDTADRESGGPVVVDRGVHSVRIEAQVVGAAATAANRGPVEAAEACAVQDVAWIDEAAPDKHQRRLHNSIRIS